VVTISTVAVFGDISIAPVFSVIVDDYC